MSNSFSLYSSVLVSHSIMSNNNSSKPSTPTATTSGSAQFVNIAAAPARSQASGRTDGTAPAEGSGLAPQGQQVPTGMAAPPQSPTIAGAINLTITNGEHLTGLPQSGTKSGNPKHFFKVKEYSN